MGSRVKRASAGRKSTKTKSSAAVIDEEQQPPGPDEELRAEIAADASAIFEAEDDDDQPILQTPPERSGSSPSATAEASAPDHSSEPTEGRRRRRRRRRRGGRTGNLESDATSTPSLPSYTTSPAFDKGGDGNGEAAQRGPQVIELAPGELTALDGLAGRDLADGIAALLASFDRTVGAVSLRQIADTAQRRGKLSGDMQLAQSQIAAAVRADNARRTEVGQRPRFRLAGGRIGLTDWLLEPELARFEREALTALARYRDAARRAFIRKLNELPGYAFIELCVFALERVGVKQFRQVKFPGASGSEMHFSAVLHTPATRLGEQLGTGEGTRLAVVIRKDGRDLGRERVTELRGTVHHYGSCSTGWIITSGQVLSGAREEASATGVLPVTLLDGMAIAALCEQHGVAVLQAQHPIAIPDVDLFEALRAS